MINPPIYNSRKPHREGGRVPNSSEGLCRAGKAMILYQVPVIAPQWGCDRLLELANCKFFVQLNYTGREENLDLYQDTQSLTNFSTIAMLR